MHISVTLALLLFLQAAGFSDRGDDSPRRVVIDDFESYQDGGIPTRWKMLRGREMVPVEPEFMVENGGFKVVDDHGNNALRVYSHGEVATLSMPMDEDTDSPWDLRKNPILSWDWRANELPAGAREDVERFNDTGAALYVIFSIGGFIVKRPTAIKYAYSSSLPVGTVVPYGKLRVVIVSSGKDGLGDWRHIERNVVEDYRKFFGSEPPENPLLIRLWSDTDNLDGRAEADFDNIVIR